MRWSVASGFCLGLALLGACNINELMGTCPPGEDCSGNGGNGDGGGVIAPDRKNPAGPGTATPFDPAAPGSGGSTGVKLDDKGNVILDPGNYTGAMRPIIWVANSAEGTVSKVDTRTMKELARYVTYPGGGGDPSRSTVNLNGDAVVANRANGSDKASAIKIAGDLPGCIDRNGNGKIDTATGTTPIPWPAGMAQSPDECVLWFTKLTAQSLPRAAGWNAETSELGQQVYIGLHNTSQLLRLDGKTGAILKTINVAPNNPYGLVLDKDGDVWIRGSNGTLARVSVRAGDTVKQYPDNGCAYGIAADAKGRIYTSWAKCVGRFDPATEKWERLDVGSAGRLRGLAVDQKNGVWIADDEKGMHHVDASGATMVYKSLVATGAGPVGAAIDFDNNPWVISQAQSSATKINPVDYKFSSVPVGSGPYTYSDMTGFQLRNAGAPSGKFLHTFQGCTDGTETRWVNLSWELLAPPNTQVTIRARYAKNTAELATAAWVDVVTVPTGTSPARLVGPRGTNVLQVEVGMKSADAKITPILSGLSVGFNCGLLG